MSKWDTKFVKKGYTFDDVLLIPAESHVLPNEVEIGRASCRERVYMCV